MFKVTSKVIESDLRFIHKSIRNEIPLLNSKSLVITGCGGFLGRYLSTYFTYFSHELDLKRIVCIDNFKNGIPAWLIELQENSPKGFLEIYKKDVTDSEFSTFISKQKANYFIHAASIASPTFYREFPLETAKANTLGWNNLLDGALKNNNLVNLLYFSSSEIYGNPDKSNIPTSETYNGNVSCSGPRACYDESKRYGETLSWIYRSQYSMPVTVVRPFNNYGPGMPMNDKRLPADLAASIIYNRDIELYSNGSPTRTFCYVSDAIIGYIKALLIGVNETFNIGSDSPEISVLTLANIFAQAGQENFGYSKEVLMKENEDKNYLADNPQRRCPDISKARSLLKYEPSITLERGVRKYLQYCHENK